MELIVPEILAEARHLSWPILLAGLVLGLVLWLAGWWTYRFWVALVTTVAAGVLGLYESNLFQMQPLLAALLLAIAAGLLALSLMRLFAFVVAGVGFLALAKVVAPSVEAPWVCFLAGGILAIILFRPWMMALTSFGGAVLVLYISMCLLEQLFLGDCAHWGRAHGILLNWLCVLGTGLGAIVQFLIHRRGRKSGKGGTPAPSIVGRIRALVPLRKAA